jgi:hypothetical protein
MLQRKKSSECSSSAFSKAGHGVLASRSEARGQGKSERRVPELIKPQRISALIEEELASWALANGAGLSQAILA